MSFVVVTTSALTAVADDGTLTIDYPAGTAGTTVFLNDGHVLVINDNDEYASVDGSFDVDFGDDEITITNRSGHTWPAYARYKIQFAIKTGAEVARDDGYVHTAQYGDGFEGLKKAWAVSKFVRCTPGVDYTMPASDYLTAVGESVHIDAAHSRFLLTDTGSEICRLRAGWDAVQDVSAASGFTITVEDGSVYSRGDILKIISDDPLPEYSRNGSMGEFVEISEVDGDELTLMRRLYYAYTTNIKVGRINQSANIRVDIGEVVIPIDATGRNVVSILSAYAPRVTIDRIPVLPESGSSLLFSSVLGGDAYIGTMGTARNLGGAREGYGFVFQNSESCRARVRYSSGGTRHAFDGGGGDGGTTAEGDFETRGGNAYNKVYNSLVVGAAAAPFQCHHGVRDLTFEDCVTVGGNGAFTTRAVRSTFNRCVAYYPEGGPVFGAFEQYDPSECDTDDTVFRDCIVIGCKGSLFDPSAGTITIDGGYFELAAGVTLNNGLILCNNERIRMVNRPRFVINGTISNRVIRVPDTSTDFAELDLGDSDWTFTQATNPSLFVELAGSTAPDVKWDGLRIRGSVNSFSGLVGNNLPGTGSRFGPAEIATGFSSIVATKTIAEVQSYITGLIRDTANRREYRMQTNSLSLGTVTSGTLTLGPTVRLIHYANGGAHTLAPPTVDCDLEVLVTNNASAGAITTSGWNYVRGDSFTTTDGHRFLCRVRRVSANVRILDVLALQ